MIELRVRSFRGQEFSEVHRLDEGDHSIGRDPDNNIVLPGHKVSGRHALLSLRDHKVTLRDLSSTNGTYVNEERLVPGEAVPVPEDATIHIGEFVLTWKDEPESGIFPLKIEAKEPFSPLEKAADEFKRQIFRELHERLNLRRMEATGASEDQLREQAVRTLTRLVAENQHKLPRGVNSADILKELMDEAFGLGPLEDLLAQKEVTEIMVNGPDRIYVEIGGKIYLTKKRFSSTERLMHAIERIVGAKGRRIDEMCPYVDTRLDDGSRVNAIIPPLALDGPCLTIRKFPQERLGMRDLYAFGSLSRNMIKFLKCAVENRQNILVSGGTGSGKTTLLNILSSYIPKDERIITIEDAAELNLPQEHVIRLEARPENIEGKGAVTIRDLVRNSLRMRPDRIVVGEVRGGEAIDMLQAMNTGHDGSLTTCHANSAQDAIARITTMCLMSGLDVTERAIKEQIASAINIIVHMARLVDGSRKVVHICETDGMEGDNVKLRDIFKFQQTGLSERGEVLGRFVYCGNEPRLFAMLRERNLPVPQFDTSSSVVEPPREEP